MLIAQITDIHLGFDPSDSAEMNRLRLDAVLDRLLALDPAPDLLVLSGDLTHGGEAWAYDRLRECLARWPRPIAPCLGNHDSRAAFTGAFADLPFEGEFAQYARDLDGRRLVVLDTVEEGRHDGSFCEDRAWWLEGRLAEAPATPTLLVLHHPPVATGIDWMSADPHAPWVRRLGAVVRRHPQVVGAVCGHLHRPMAAAWAGTTLVCCPPIAPMVSLDLRPMIEPDDRPLMRADPPGYALHLWTADGLTSHLGSIGEGEVVTRYDAAISPMIDRFIAERRS